MSRTTKSKSLNVRPGISNVRAVDQHLKNLHRLKTQVQQLDIIRVPHKQAPITRQIKQLMDVSSQLLRKRARNQLGTSTKSINNLIQTIGDDEIDKDKGLIQSKCLKKKLDEVFSQKHDVEVINNHEDDKIKMKQIGDFLTHNECYSFDPLEAAFKRMDPKGEGFVDYKTIVQLMNMLGIEAMSRETMAKLLEVDKLENVTFSVFKRIVGRFEAI